MSYFFYGISIKKIDLTTFKKIKAFLNFKVNSTQYFIKSSENLPIN